MLASLLPGIRELRAPLVTGYIYLLALLLLYGNKVPTNVAADSPLKLPYDLVGWLGKPTAIAVSTFVAYLVGSVLEVHAATVSRSFRKIRSHSKLFKKRRHSLLPGDERGLKWLAPELTPASVNALGRYIVERVRGKLSISYDTDLKAEGFKFFLQDLPQLHTRLYGANKDLYGDYDRLAAEADLKVNVGISGNVLSGVAGVVVHPLWAILCGPMLVLFYRGLSSDRQANDILVQSVVTDIVKSPKLEGYIDEAASHFRETEEIRTARRMGSDHTSHDDDER
ncbi:hypothetical protein [Streptomyces echinatus]|uniref:Uncharacterized protein n=1 Tax=Streptomyces echinatus TaxID=67293 RepID=A0A7W9Q2T7_9ACTN|nr:hypothetical protein [Streptomyces echinatus]MBB5932591.1 hypothetical protein [Streptomyces echinatus]